MKRPTIALLAAAAILLIGGFALWRLLIVPRLAPPAVVPPPAVPPPAAPPVLPEAERHAAMNAYLTAPSFLPAVPLRQGYGGQAAARVELTLIRATLWSTVNRQLSTVIFEGAQRIVVQPGVVEKALSERIPAGHWDRLTLTFSPAAELAMADGRTTAALVGRREAVLSFEAEVPASRTLALFARVPLEADAAIGAVTTLNVSPAPQTAERYVFGAFLLDARGRGDVWSIPSPSLAAAVKEDLGFDITRQLGGSSGFVPTETPPD